MERIYTPEEANAALDEVRPLAECMVAHRRALADAQAKQASLVTRIAGNGGDLSPSEVREPAADIARELDAIAESVRQLNALGVQVKDLDEGLVDFPARHRGEDVLLCWKVGEPEVAYWHDLEEGFAGRKPLPFDPRER
jgi:hypothetical protein